MPVKSPVRPTTKSEPQAMNSSWAKSRPMRKGGRKMQLGHTILAMLGAKPARVRCNTCQGEHNYRHAPASPKKGSWEPREVRERREAKPTITSWEALIAQKDMSRARRYSARERYQ